MLFFFYGTLIAGSANRVAPVVHGRLRDCGPATVPGLLHAIPDQEGWYPALTAGEGTVHGRLYEAGADFGAAELALLDGWEEFDAADPRCSLYLRKRIRTVGADGASLEAEAYCYNRPLPQEARLIPDGDFRGWLEREGVTGFGVRDRA